MRLFLCDNVVIPSSGVFGFKVLDIREAIQGIILAHQDDRLVNYLSDTDNAQRLSRLSNLKLDAAKDNHAWVQSVEAQMEHRDTLMMYYVTSDGSGQNGAGKLFTHRFLLAVKWDTQSVQGVADVVRLSCPADTELADWVRTIGKQVVADIGGQWPDEEVSDG